MKNFLKILLAILLALCLITDGVYFYFSRYVITGTHNSSFVGSIDSEGKTPFVEVLYKTGDNGVGIPSFEVKFNNLTDVANKGVFSYGMQVFNFDIGYSYIGCSWPNYYYQEKISDESYFYNESGAISYNATSSLRDNSGFLVELNGKLFLLKWSNENVHWRFSGLFNIAHDFVVYNYSTFIARLFNACLSIDYGSYTNLCLVYDHFFEVLSYSEETKRFDSVVTDNDLVDDIIKNYIYVKVQKSAEGLKDKSESMFNCLYGDSTAIGGYSYA